MSKGQAAKHLAQRPAPRRKAAVRRTDAWERQAHDAGKRFAVGETGVGVTPAPAAAFRLPASSGQPLPLSLRGTLEQAFDADLASVRVHTDAPAALAAQALGARAFAAGAHLAFGFGQFQPATDAGRQLIAHEVAHALQQAGRRTHGGRLRVTDALGDAAPQLDTLPDFDTLKAIHAPAKSSASRAAYDGVVLLLEPMMKSPDPKTALSTYVTTTLPKLKALKWPHQAESLLYDSCKKKGLYELAAQLLERDNFLGGNRINTALFSNNLVEELEKRNGGWAVYAKAIGAVSWLKEYETEWLARFEQFVMGAYDEDYEVQPRAAAKGGTGTIYDHLVDLNNDLFDSKTVSNNEWIYRGLTLMYALEGQRVNGCVRMVNDTRKQLPSGAQRWTFEERRLRAQALVDWGKQLPSQVPQFINIGDRDDAAAIAAALKPYLTKLGERASAIGTKALAVWQQAASIESQLRPATDADADAIAALAERRQRAGRLGTDKGVPRVLARLLQALNKSDASGSRTLDSVEWRDRVAPWIDELSTLSDKTLSYARLEAFRAGRTDDALAYIALEAFILRLTSHLRWTRSESIKTDGGTRAVLSTPDEALYQRIEVARWIRRVAKPLQWTSVEDAAAAILQATPEKGSILAITSFDDGEVFKRDVLAPEDAVSKARDDFGSRAIRGMEPLTLDTLAIFYRAVFFRDLAQQLRLMIPASNAAEQDIVTRGKAVPYLVTDAKKALVSQAPQRWHTRAAHYAPKAGDKRGFAEVLRAHPAFQALVSAHQPGDCANIVPLAPEAVFVWFVPPFDKMRELLRTSLVFQGLVADTFESKLKPEERFKKQQKLTLADWLQRLQDTVAKKLESEEYREKEWPAMVEHLYRLSMGEYDSALTEFRTAFTWAMRRDRQLIARRIEPLLAAYDDDHHNFRAIRDVIRELGRFNGANAALLDFDREMQMALLLLEVAPALRSALKYADLFDVVYPMLGFTEPALERARQLKGYSADQRRPWLPDHENTDAWIAGRFVDLNATVEHLKAVRAEVQASRGFRADKDQQHIVAQVKLSSPLPVFAPLFPRYGGFLGNSASQGYRITEVVRSFIYHPPYGDAPSAFDPKAPSGYSPAQFLEPDGKTELTASDDEPLLRLQVIEPTGAPAKGQPPQYKVVKTLDLTRKDLDRFEDLCNGITWAGFGSAMGNIQAGIEAVLEFYLDVAELLPGVGPAIAAARIAAALTEFLSSADYTALVEAAKGGLVEVVSGLLDALTQRIDADQLILLLLFGDPRLEMMLARSTIGTGADKGTPQGGGGGSGKFGALKKTMGAFRRLGRALFKALRKLDRYVERPMQDVRIFASTRPLVSFALQFVADHIFQILAMKDKIAQLIAAKEKGAAVADIERDLKEQQVNFGRKMYEVVTALQSFKLPHTVVDISPAIAAVLTLAEGYVIKRTGFAGKVINLALKHSGAYDVINQHFAQAIVEGGADPNIYWREKILPQIEKQFNAARDDLVKGINEVLTNGPLKGIFDPVPPVQPATVTADAGEQFEDTSETYLPSAAEAEADAAPSPSDDRPLVPRPANVPRVDAGEPLAGPLRARLEGQMGQDFGHVRLHTGAVGQQMTDAYGADALTSGSHVFVRRGKLADTLDHELVHVVQQTGSRPLGRPHDSTPVAGHPERGLDWQPGNEAEAGVVADALRGGGARLGGAAKPAGLQPSGVSWFTIARLMREVSNLEAVTASAKKTDAFTGAATLPKDIQGAVDKVLAALKAPTKNAAVWRHPGPFTKAMPMVEARLANAAYADPITKAAQVIAMEAMEPIDAKPGDPRYLSTSHFERHLEAYVLAKTGLGIALQLNGHKVSVPGKDFEAVDLASPVKQISLVHIHLPLMDGRAPLWAAAIDNTWPTSLPDYKARMRHALRPLLESKGIQPGIWPLMGTEFRFSLIFKAEAEKYLKQQEGAKPDPVPSWQDYVKTSKDASGDVGLRLAYYDHASQKGKGRESHHLTQYLVAEFFANGNDAKAFDGTRSYPGVFPVGSATSKAVGSGSIGKIADKDAGGTEIDVDTTKGKGRGAFMPTISLAAVTHQRGKLHVTPEADDVNGGTKKSQGTALKNEFHRQLPPLVASPNANEYKAYVDQHGRDAVAKEIYGAVQRTYQAVEHHMSTQLTKNMPQLEYEYYMGLVEGTSQDLADKTNPDTETQAQKDFLKALHDIPPVAKKHNHDEMLKFGWKTK